MKITVKQANEAEKLFEKFCSQQECKNCARKNKCDKISKELEEIREKNYNTHQEITKHLLHSTSKSKYFRYDIHSRHVGDKLEYYIVESGKLVSNVLVSREIFSWSETHEIKEYLEGVK